MFKFLKPILKICTEKTEFLYFQKSFYEEVVLFYTFDITLIFIAYEIQRHVPP